MNKRFHEQKVIKCSTGEIVNGYNNYLQTNHWKQMRVKVAEANDYTCIRCCGVFKEGYHIHHNTYNRVGNEKLSDLSFYCHKCHAVLHSNRKEKRTFNKQYHSIISSKMAKFTEEQILDVLKYIDKIAKKTVSK